jgi:hypothetical protein
MLKPEDERSMKRHDGFIIYPLTAPYNTGNNDLDLGED